MSTRRTHTKSRTGCTNCKRRKVKCDEVFPVCFNCKRHGVSCSLNFASPGSSAELDRCVQTPVLSDRGPLSPDSSANEVSPRDPMSHAFAPGSDQILPCPPQDLWSRDLELLHHFLTITADTLALRHDNINVWKNVMPREGYKRPFVMHGLLSIAAAHKAYLIPTQRKIYLAFSDYHHTVGSESFRTELQNITNDNWAAVFGFACVVVFFVVCLPSRSENLKLEDPIANLVELMGVTRGVRSALAPILPKVVRSEYAPLAYGTWPVGGDVKKKWRPSLEFTTLPLDTYEALDRLREFLKADIPSMSDEHYAAAIENLEVSARLIASAGVHAECGAVLAWPFGLHDSILIDIQTRKPHALLLLTILAVYLASLERSFWFARGWGKAILDEVERLLAGQPRFLKFVDWPKKQMVELYGLM